MIKILWKELEGGRGIDSTLDRVSQGDNVLSLVYCTQELLRIGIVVSFSLACEELGRSDRLGQMRCSSHHGGFPSRVMGALTHVGCSMM